MHTQNTTLRNTARISYALPRRFLRTAVAGTTTRAEALPAATQLDVRHPAVEHDRHIMMGDWMREAVEDALEKRLRRKSRSLCDFELYRIAKRAAENVWKALARG